MNKTKFNLSVAEHPREFRLICGILRGLTDYHSIRLFDVIKKVRIIEITVEGETRPCPVCQEVSLMTWDERGIWFCGKCAHNEFEPEPTDKEPKLDSQGRPRRSIVETVDLEKK